MFCLQCGHKLVLKTLDNKHRSICLQCGWVYYQQLKVGAAVIIEKENQILLLKRANEPWKDYWYLPAGFVEFDEDPKMAAIRETKEEIGLDVEINGMFNYYFYDDDPRGNGLLMVYISKALRLELELNVENSEYCFFSKSELPKNLCGAGHRTAINDWVKYKDG